MNRTLLLLFSKFDNLDIRAISILKTYLGVVQIRKIYENNVINKKIGNLFVALLEMQNFTGIIRYTSYVESNIEGVLNLYQQYIDRR